MSLTSISPLISEATLAELSDRGQAIYEADLRQKLEAEARTGFVAIHIDAKEYAVARTSAAAMREMRRRFPADGRLFVRRIGSEPQYSLASRIIQSDMIEGKL